MTSSLARLVLVLATLGACAVPDAETTDETAQDVHGAVNSGDIYITSPTIAVGACAATRVSPLWAITSRRCDVHVGDTITFLNHETQTPEHGTVQQVIGKPGTTVASCANRDTCLDSNGKFADLALIRISAPLPTTFEDPLGDTGSAIMNWRYPGSGVSGYEVGPEFLNGWAEVWYVSDTLDSSSDSSGSFETTHDNSDPTDRGGGFWYGNRVIGTLWGGGYDVWNGNWQLYTSVAYHLDWILSTIGYSWRGTPVQANVAYSGTTMEVFYGTERVCQYACEHSYYCEAYNYTPGTASCQILTSVTSLHTQSGAHSAIHYGASTGKTADVVGYTRSDGYTSVVHKTETALHEFYRTWYGSTWAYGGLPLMSGEPIAIGGKLSGYRRADGINVVLYRSTHGKVIEVALVPGVGWQTFVLATGAVGDPAGFIRGDGLSSVVYRSANGLRELHLEASGWVLKDPTAAIPNAPSIGSEPVPFVDRWGTTMIVFTTTTNKIARLSAYATSPGTWQLDLPSDIAGAPAPAPGARPYGYTRKSGKPAIVYRSASQRLIELRFESTWVIQDLTPPVNPSQPNDHLIIHDPVAYVRTDGVESVVWRAYSGHLREASRNPTLQWWDLSAQYGIPTLLNDPSVYIRLDNANGILYPLNGLHAGELSYTCCNSGWGRNDLSLDTGEQF